MTMKKVSKVKSVGVQFKFSGPRTPQRNGKVERKFQIIYGRIRSMLNEYYLFMKHYHNEIKIEMLIWVVVWWKTNMVYVNL
jgi:hypothetical protein